MDFSFTPEQDEAAALAASIVTAEVTPERLRAADSEEGRFDGGLWKTLGDAGLLGLHLPSEYGAGLGLVELARVLVELGRRVAPVPLASHGAASAVIASHGSAAQRAAWLPGAASGSEILAAAVAESHDPLPDHPETVAVPSAAGWTLSGAKTQVRGGTLAQAFLVPARIGADVGLFIVRVDDPGVAVTPQRVLDGDVTAHLVLDDVALPAERLLEAEGAATRLALVATACVCAEQLGVTEEALRITSAYATTREQFGRPIGSFQAVSQRLADGYIDTLGQRLTLWQAVWRLDEGLEAATEVAVAKLWAADAGHRLAHTTVHVHGGVGIDLDGEPHRYFTTAKRLEFEYGGSTAQARTIGRALATQPA